MNRMIRRWNSLLLGLLFGTCAAVTCLNVLGAEPLAGWRGDGTGKYPAANPPTAWSRTSTGVKPLRFTAEVPTGPESGVAMIDGVVRDWLVVGPLPMEERGGGEPSALADEAALAPVAGQPAGSKQWRKVTLDSAYLDFTQLVGKPEDEDFAAFAYTNIYSPLGGRFRIHCTIVGHARLFLNGKPLVPMGTRITLDLAKGWNRLLLRVTPGEKDWYAVPVFRGHGQCDYDETGIAWRVSLPGTWPGFYGGGMGAGAPLIVGDKIYLLSEPHDLICLSKADGKMLWVRRASYFEAASDEEKKRPADAGAQGLAEKIDAINALCVAGTASAEQLLEKVSLEGDLRKQMKQIDEAKYANQAVPDVGFSGFTPSTDGEFIYAFFGDGVSACFTLDGVRRWIRVDQRIAVEHGFSSSPILVDGKFVVFLRNLIAMDCATGKLAWETPIVEPEGLNPGNFIHGSLATATIGDTRVILLGNGMIVRAADGKPIVHPQGDNQSVPSPVIEGRQVFHVSQGNSNLTVRTLPDRMADPLELSPQTVAIDLSAFPKHYLPWHLSSPLVHEGLAYLVNNAGVLTVIDVAAGKIVYQKLLDLDVFQDHNEGAARGVGASPILAGKSIYLLGSSGTTLVIEPGRVYRQIAKNKLESVAMLGHWSERQERFVANLVPDGNRLLIRGEDCLYAIGPR
jgi:outer membrane protein assembly factor BamB